jgi:tryptophanase
LRDEKSLTRLKHSRHTIASVAVPRKVYTISHIEYAIDRVCWLHTHREPVRGLKLVYKPPVLRFFFGKLEVIDN